MGCRRISSGYIRKLTTWMIVIQCCVATAALAEPRPALVYPVNMSLPSSGFGLRKHPIFRSVRHHSGVDIPAPIGSEIRTIATGVVTFAGETSALGRTITITHSDALVSRYAHCSEVLVPVGTWVQSGQVIAKVGMTGRTTGPHLHFELRRNSEPLDPELIFPGLFSPPKG